MTGANKFNFLKFQYLCLNHEDDNLCLPRTIWESNEILQDKDIWKQNTRDSCSYHLLLPWASWDSCTWTSNLYPPTKAWALSYSEFQIQCLQWWSLLGLLLWFLSWSLKFCSSVLFKRQPIILHRVGPAGNWKWND